jgi:hypothetical protein
MKRININEEFLTGIPEGWEPVRIDIPMIGEYYIDWKGVMHYNLNDSLYTPYSLNTPFIIIRLRVKKVTSDELFEMYAEQIKNYYSEGYCIGVDDGSGYVVRKVTYPDLNSKSLIYHFIECIQIPSGEVTFSKIGYKVKD